VISLVRAHPVPPLFVGVSEDGLFDDAGTADPRAAASFCAWEHGLDVGGSVWIGWGKLPPSDCGDRRTFDVGHVEQWIVRRTYAEGARPPLVRRALSDPSHPVTANHHP